MRSMLPLVLLLSTGAIGDGDVRSDGAFGFPQRTAVVLCDTPDLRLSAACDGTHWFVQAVLWKDGDDTPGLTEDGRKIGDSSTLAIDADADDQETRDVDRAYSLDPWPSRPGLNYSVCMGPRASTPLQADSKGRGSIRYVDQAGAKVRVDTFFIPLAEVGRGPGQAVKFAYVGQSTVPAMTVNSVGFVPASPERRYYAHHIPAAMRHAWTIAPTQAEAFDPQLVPEGRGTIAVKAKRPPPAIGTMVGEPGGPPELTAQGWKNWKGGAPPTLAGLRGKVVVVEFWATWCGPCIAGIPHLNDLHQRHHKDGLVILSMTDQDQSAISAYVDGRGEGMSYAVGMGSSATEDYGISAIPHAFIIGRDGRLRWAGNPGSSEFDAQVAAALEGE